MQRLIATGFGTGYFPFAPGTLASALAAGIGWLTGYLLGFDYPLTAAVFAVLGATAFWFSIRLAPAAETHFGAADPCGHVIDEIAGQFLTLSIVFAFPADRYILAFAASFALFRVFDIAKPFPIRRLEKLGGGWGVSLDDVLAGLYAGVCAVVLSGLF